MEPYSKKIEELKAGDIFMTATGRWVVLSNDGENLKAIKVEKDAQQVDFDWSDFSTL